MFSSRFGEKPAYSTGELTGELRRRTDGGGDGPRSGGQSKALILILVLLAVFVGLGAAGNYFVLDRLRAADEVRAVVAERDRLLSADAEAYDKALAALDFKAAMEPRQLGRSGGLAASQETMGKTAEVVARYRALSDERFAAFRDRIVKLKMRAEHRRDLLTDYDRQLRAEAPLLKAYWDHQEGVVEEARAALDVLARNRGAWRAQGSMMLFYNERVLATYNQHILAMRRHAYEFDFARARLRGEPAPVPPVQSIPLESIPPLPR